MHFEYRMLSSFDSCVTLQMGFRTIILATINSIISLTHLLSLSFPFFSGRLIQRENGNGFGSIIIYFQLGQYSWSY
jgi:hypothetical protein